jgi:hypothetical protein
MRAKAKAAKTEASSKKPASGKQAAQRENGGGSEIEKPAWRRRRQRRNIWRKWRHGGVMKNISNSAANMK